ncbi:hypothetical protein HanRHA438_Chr03g0130491 [Helianthus annuus]|nr:hypothetical protein HanRHA438_Chr03g0130491 [Helianthus annuus]
MYAPPKVYDSLNVTHAVIYMSALYELSTTFEVDRVIVLFSLVLVHLWCRF